MTPMIGRGLSTRIHRWHMLVAFGAAAAFLGCGRKTLPSGFEGQYSSGCGELNGIERGKVLTVVPAGFSVEGKATINSSVTLTSIKCESDTSCTFTTNSSIADPGKGSISKPSSDTVAVVVDSYSAGEMSGTWTRGKCPPLVATAATADPIDDNRPVPDKSAAPSVQAALESMAGVYKFVAIGGEKYESPETTAWCKSHVDSGTVSFTPGEHGLTGKVKVIKPGAGPFGSLALLGADGKLLDYVITDTTPTEFSIHILVAPPYQGSRGQATGRFRIANNRIEHIEDPEDFYHTNRCRFALKKSE